MIYGYIRVSTDKQTTENQRFEILKFASEKRLHIDAWVEETISATKHLDDRQLGQLLSRLQADDVLIVTELSRLGRSLLEVMSILHRIMETKAKVFTTKERYELGNTISSKVLALCLLADPVEVMHRESRGPDLTNDGLDLVEKIMDLEEEFGIDFSDDDWLLSAGVPRRGPLAGGSGAAELPLPTSEEGADRVQADR